MSLFILINNTPNIYIYIYMYNTYYRNSLNNTPNIYICIIHIIGIHLNTNIK